MTVDAFILAGGGSVRFGSDKALAEIDGVPLLTHVFRELQRRFDTVRVVSTPGRSYADLGIDTVYDTRPDEGPLAGIHTALTHATTRLVAIAPCDVWGLKADWYEALEAAAAGGAAALWDDRWHPLFGVYDRAILPIVDRRLTAGQRAVRDLLDEVGARIPAPADFAQLVSINRPGDLP